MRINLSTQLLDLSENSFKNEKNEDLSLQEALKLAALAEFQGENATPEQKFTKYEIAKKVKKSDGSVDLTSEEISVLKKNASKRFNTELYGSFCDILESCGPSEVKNIKDQAKAVQ